MILERVWARETKRRTLGNKVTELEIKIARYGIVKGVRNIEVMG